MTVLSDRGTPTSVAWTMLRSPRSLMGPLEPTALAQAVAGSPLQAKYGQPVDRESAYERLATRLAPPPTAPAPEAPAPKPSAKEPAQRRREREPEPSGGVVADVLGSAAFRSFTRSAASALGREITRGLFGTRRRRR